MGDVSEGKLDGHTFTCAACGKQMEILYCAEIVDGECICINCVQDTEGADEYDDWDAPDPLDDDRDQESPCEFSENYDWEDYPWDADPDWR